MASQSSEDLYTLPPPFTHTAPRPRLLTQGAEALLYKTEFLLPSLPCALKYRPSKPYRHPILDKRLTRHRILIEARILVKCRREGVLVPGVLALDVDVRAEFGGGGWMMMEWVEGRTVRDVLIEYSKKKKGPLASVPEDDAREGPLTSLMRRIGQAVGRLHEIGVVHGDLTTSNMMLRPHHRQAEQRNGFSHGGRQASSDMTVERLDGDVVLIDFGLASQNIQDEDKAVDLYVLERAFGSTHPAEEDSFQEVLNGYRQSYKGAKIVLKRLEDVRMRGRKRSMIG